MTFEDIHIICVLVGLILTLTLITLSICISKDKCSSVECLVGGIAFMFIVMLVAFRGYLSRQEFYYFGHNYICAQIEEIE